MNRKAENTGLKAEACPRPRTRAGKILASCFLFSGFWLLASAPAAPAACSATPAGTVMADGSVYAGMTPDGNVPMYAQRCDIGMSWSGSSCTGSRSNPVWSTGATIATGYTSATTGQANTTGLAALSNADSPYVAAQTCHNLNEDGHTDWYLPGSNEFNVLYWGYSAIGNFSTSSEYWTSTEASGAFALAFSLGSLPPGLSNYFKTATSSTAIRCVRKGTGSQPQTGSEGNIMYNKDNHVLQFCNGSNWVAMGKPWTGADGGGCSGGGTAGNIIYNHDSCVLQYCDSNVWKAIGHPQAHSCDGTCDNKVVNLCGDCGLPTAVGDVCSDGSVYAGLSTDGNVPMFTQRCDIGMTWSGSSCTGTRAGKGWSTASTGIVTGYTNANTGQANTAGLWPLSNADSPYVAAITCHSLNEDGHTDWYLPALNELNVLYLGVAAIGNFDTSGTYYWSSTENANTWAEVEPFDTGVTNIRGKAIALPVRCVRR